MVEQFKEWWQSISEREQHLSLVSAAFVILAILYWGAWQPLSNQLEDSQIKLQRAEQTLRWVENKSVELVQAGVAKKTHRGKKQSLTKVLNRTAKKYNITFSRVVNKKEQVEIWIDEVEFNRFIAWLTNLNNSDGVSVVKSDISTTDTQGKVKINRLLLSY